MPAKAVGETGFVGERSSRCRNNSTAAALSPDARRIRARAATVPAGEWMTSLGGWSLVTIAEHRMPTLAELDAATRTEHGYLASEDSFAFVKSLQQKNLIVPIVGDFAGPKALRAAGKFLRDRGNDPAVQDQLGKAYFNVGRITAILKSPDEALPSLEKARTLQNRLHPQRKLFFSPPRFRLRGSSCLAVQSLL